MRDDITNVKRDMRKDRAPQMGTYMNERDVNDPDIMQDFHGPTNMDALAGSKAFYNPESVFYFPTCIGGLTLEEQLYGQLCLAPGGGPD